MAAVATAARLRLAAVSRGVWPALWAASLVGWGLSLTLAQGLVVPATCTTAGWLADSRAQFEAGLLLNASVWLALPWGAMLLAMMPPLLAEPVAHLRRRSLARRRWRAVLLFVAGYGAVWGLAGGGLLTLTLLLKAAAPAHAALLGLGLAALWQVTPWKQICLNRCHRLPRLAAFGLGADADCLRYGVAAGVWCVGACWALMLLPLLTDTAHHAAMAVAAVLLMTERQAAPRAPAWRLTPFARMRIARA